MIDDEDEWKMKNILNFKHYKQDKRLQYCVNWKEYNVDLHWYNVDESEFKEYQKIINVTLLVFVYSSSNLHLISF